jgi:hypothetical protein
VKNKSASSFWIFLEAKANAFPHSFVSKRSSHPTPIKNLKNQKSAYGPEPLNYVIPSSDDTTSRVGEIGAACGHGWLHGSSLVATCTFFFLFYCFLFFSSPTSSPTHEIRIRKRQDRKVTPKIKPCDGTKEEVLKWWRTLTRFSSWTFVVKVKVNVTAPGSNNKKHERNQKKEEKKKKKPSTSKKSSSVLKWCWSWSLTSIFLLLLVSQDFIVMVNGFDALPLPNGNSNSASIFLPPTNAWLELSRSEETNTVNTGGNKSGRNLTQSELWRTWLLTDSNVNDTYFKANLSPALTVIERSKHLLARNLLHIFPNLILRGGYVRDVVINNLPPKDLDFYCYLLPGKSNAFEVATAIAQWSENNDLVATSPLCLMNGDACNRANVLVCAPRFQKLIHSSCDPTDLKILVELNSFSAANRLPLFSANGLTLQANLGLASSAVTLSVANAAFDARNKILNQIAYDGLGITFSEELERRVMKFVRRGWMLSNKQDAKLIKRALDYDQPNICTMHPEICVKDWYTSKKGRNNSTNKKQLRFRQFFGYSV